MAKDLRSFLTEIDDRIVRIRAAVDPVTQMGGLCQRIEQPVLFDHVTGYPGWRVVDRLLTNRELVARAASVPADRIVPSLAGRWLRPPTIPPVVVTAGPVKERVFKGPAADLTSLPVAVSSPGDSGRFLSGAHLVSVNPDTGAQNAAFVRCEVTDRRTFSAGIFRPDTLRNIALHRERGRATMPVALCIGHHPAYDMSAAASFHHPGYSEHEMTANLLGEAVELTACETVDLRVPARMEIVIEAELGLTAHVPNGPFGEYTLQYGYDPRGYGGTVTAICRRDDAIYRHLNSTRFTDHQILTGTAHAVQIYGDLVNKGHTVHDVDFPAYGSRLLLVIKATPRYDGEVRDMFLTACARNSLAKFVVIVDEDVDLDDPRDLIQAMVSMADPIASVMTIDGLPSNRLNPTARHKDNPYTCVSGKMLIDATRGSTMGQPERRKAMERIGYWPGIAVEDFL
jgi:2,5-furandicarboxylate decarboxylase 1